MNIDMNYLLRVTRELLDIPSVTGDTEAICAKTGELLRQLGLEPLRTKKGAVYATLPGEDDEHQLLVNAHLDTLGAMVTQILPNGRLRVTNVGGWSFVTYEGENLTVHTRSGKTCTGTLLYEKPSVHCFPEEARSEIRTEFNTEVRLDEDAANPEQVRALGIEVGDFISFDPRTVLTPNGFLKSRYLDDKVCVGIMLAVVKYLTDNKLRPRRTTHFYFANYEELGHGVSFIPEKTTELLSIDIGTVAEGHNASEHAVTICAKDSRTTYDFGFRKRLTDLAERIGADYRVDVHYRYGSDASMAVLRGADANFALIGPGVDATHHYERTHLDALEQTAKLLAAYVIQG